MRDTIETMTKKKLEKVLDHEFSLYIRLSGADRNGRVHCATCGKVMLWKEADCGHYISRARKAVRWNEHNALPQCRYCNSFHGGEQFLMRQSLVAKWGEKEVKHLELLAQMGYWETEDTLRIMAKDYRAKTKALLEGIR